MKLKMCFPQRNNFKPRFLADSQEQPQKSIQQNMPEAYRACGAPPTSRNHPPDGKHAARRPLPRPPPTLPAGSSCPQRRAENVSLGSAWGSGPSWVTDTLENLTNLLLPSSHADADIVQIYVLLHRDPVPTDSQTPG